MLLVSKVIDSISTRHRGHNLDAGFVKMRSQQKNRIRNGF